MEHSIDPLLRPRSIAVVGASRHPQTIGYEILHNLISHGFEGAVYPVNPQAPVVHSLKCYPSLSAIPDPVDLAVIVVPRQAIRGVLEDVVAKGVRGLVVITAGFREVGDEGEQEEERLKAAVRDAGIRMVGPNCMGVINTDPAINMNATFAATRPKRGTAGFMSQSGALGEMILARAHDIGLGIAYFVSMGNKTDVSGNDLIEAWEDDPRVKVILMYLESFGNPERFAAITRRATRKKPIVAVKSGRTAAGARAAFSHTGALAGTEVAVDSLLEQCGVLRVATMNHMFTVASAFANQPLPRSNRIAILTNAGGPAIMATDSCATLGLDVSELSEATQKALRGVLAPEASVRNPIDMIASADGARYAAALDILKQDESVDGLIVLFVSPLMINALEVAQAVIDGARGARQPILTCFMGKGLGQQGVDALREAGIPVYMFPEEAARAMAALNRYRLYRDRPEGTTPSFRVQGAGVEKEIAAADAGGRTVLSPEETGNILSAYGFPVAPSRIASTPAEAIEAASALGYPVVVKALADTLVHKTEHGAVKVDLRNGDEVAIACRGIRRALGDVSFRFQVQSMVRGGHETILGLTHDPKFGPLLMFGLGGVFVEVMKDVVFRILPITDVEAREMVRSIRGYPLLAGARGKPKADEEFLTESLLRLGQLARDFPRIEQVDFNPFIIGPDRASSFVVDARVRLTAPPEAATPPAGGRRAAAEGRI
jgi:acetyl coenzyme A synthetase (ADP forming)-like protein